MNEQKMNYEHVLSPIKIGPMTLKTEFLSLLYGRPLRRRTVM